MKLPEILTISCVLTAREAAVSKGGRFADRTGSDHIQPTLSLEANLQPVNATHVKVSISNSFSQQISILSWNNHFQTNQNAAHGSFQLTREISNGTIQNIARGPSTGHFRYSDTFPRHFFNITAGSAYTDSFDLTRLFKIPEVGMYNITMNFTSPATLVPKGIDLSMALDKLDSRKNKSHVHNLSNIRIESASVPIFLVESPPSVTSRKRTGTRVPCSARPQTSLAIVKARGNARSLAKYAEDAILPPLGIASHGLTDNALWVQYFSDDNKARNITSIYQAIANYGLNGDTAGVIEFCDLEDNDHMCTDDSGAIAYGTSGGGSTGGRFTITFCRHFFELPIADTCNVPSLSNNVMTDQGGVYLHELAKSEPLTGVANVTDGYDDECYTWDCIKSAVAGLNGEKSYLLAATYELFAYAARAKSSPQCPKTKAVGPQPLPSPSPPPPPPTPPAHEGEGAGIATGRGPPGWPRGNIETGGSSSGSGSGIDSNVGSGGGSGSGVELGGRATVEWDPELGSVGASKFGTGRHSNAAVDPTCGSRHFAC